MISRAQNYLNSREPQAVSSLAKKFGGFGAGVGAIVHVSANKEHINLFGSRIVDKFIDEPLMPFVQAVPVEGTP